MTKTIVPSINGWLDDSKSKLVDVGGWQGVHAFLTLPFKQNVPHVPIFYQKRTKGKILKRHYYPRQNDELKSNSFWLEEHGEHCVIQVFDAGCE